MSGDFTLTSIVDPEGEEKSVKKVTTENPTLRQEGRQQVLERPYIISSRYLDNNKGNRARIYYRGFDPVSGREHTGYKDIDVKTVIPSKQLSQREAERILFNLENSQYCIQMGYRFSLQSSEGRYIIQATLPDKKKEVREGLGLLTKKLGLQKNLFLFKRFSPSDYLHSVYEPTRLLNPKALFDSDERYVSIGSPSLERLVNDVHLVIDIETEDWEKEDIEDKISLVICTPSVDYLRPIIFSRYPSPQKIVDGAEVRIFKDHGDLTSQLSKLVEEYDPLGIVGYNLQFDFIQHLRRVDKEFSMGVDGRKVRIRGSGGGTKSTAVSGRYVHDLYLVANQQMSHLIAQKLDNLIEFFGTGTKKDLNYFELIDSLKSGDIRAFRYTVGDGKRTLALFRSQVEELYRDVLELRLPPEAIEKGFHSAAERAFNHYFFVRNHTLPQSNRLARRRDQFNLGNEEMMLHNIEPIDPRPPIKRDEQRALPDKITFPRKDGVFKDGAFFFPGLLIQCFDPLYRVSSYHKNYWEFYKKQDSELRYRGLWKLRELILRDVMAYQDACLDFNLKMDEPFPEIIEPRISTAGHSMQFEAYDRRYKQFYGHKQVGLFELNKRVVEMVKLWRTRLKPEDWLNYSSRFLLLDGRSARHLAYEPPLGVIVASGGALSKDNFFAVKRNGKKTLYVQGANLYRRDKPRWAWKLINNLLLRACEQAGDEGALDHDDLEGRIIRAGEEICEGVTPRSELVFTKNKRGRSEAEKNRKDKERGKTFLMGLEEPSKEYEDRRGDRWRGINIVGLTGFGESPLQEFLSSKERPNADHYVNLFKTKWYPKLMELLLKDTPITKTIL